MNSTRKTAEDGGLRGIPRMKPTYPMTVHQQDAGFLARRQEFTALVAEIARKLAPFAITKEEKQAVWDAQRPASPRLSIRSLEILCELAARSDRPFTLEQAIQQAVVQRMTAPAPLCVVDTGMTETRAQSRGDIDRWQFHVERTPVRRDQALDALGLHKAAIATDMIALMQWPSNGRRVFA